MKNNIKAKIILKVMQYGAVPREALFVLHHDVRYTERIIKACIEEKLMDEHIRKDIVKVDYLAPSSSSKFKRIVDGKRMKKEKTPKEEHHYFRTLKYYTVTNAGMRYVLNCGLCVDLDIPTAELLRKQFSRGGKAADRLLGLVQSELMLMDNLYIDKYVYEYDPCRIYLLVKEVSFVNAKTVKTIVQAGGTLSVTPTPSHDYDRGRYNGCYISRWAIIAVYNNLSPGFSWSKQSAAPEKRAIELFSEVVKRYSRPFVRDPLEIKACILVKNPTHLKQIILDLPGARRVPSSSPKSRAFRLGDPFQFMYAIPVNYEGQQELYCALRNEEFQIRKDILQGLSLFNCKSGDSLFGISTVIFPDVDENLRFIVSVMLDIKLMYKLAMYIKTNKHYKFGVICPYAHSAYWKAIFGNELHTVPSEYILKIKAENEDQN